MEEIIQSKTLTLPLGIRCMELNVKEIDAAIKEFLKKSKYALNFTSTPSWKFPHINIEKLDVSDIMETYRMNAFSEDQQYLELLEILIDRLYFSLITMYQLLESTETHIDAMGQGDCRPQLSWDMEKMSKKSSEDQTQRPFHMANLGILLRQIQAKLITTVELNSQKAIKNSKILSQKGKDGIDLTKIRTSSTQTDMVTLEGCETCFISQNLLKFIREIVYHCMNALEIDIEKSQTHLVRKYLEENVWMYSQRSVVIQWCESIKSDCETIVKKSETILQNNSEYQKRIDSANLSIDEGNKKFTKLVEELQSKVATLETDLENEKKQKKRFAKQRDSAISTVSDLDHKLQEKNEEYQKLLNSKAEVEKKLENLEGAHEELQDTQFKTLKELAQSKKEVEGEINEKRGLERRVAGLDAQVEMKDQEIQHLKESLEKADSDIKENADLNKALLLMKKRMEKFKQAELKVKQEREDGKKEIQRLKEELEKKVSEIELLTLYPDLNGPINPPSKVAGSPLEAMQMQVDSNQVRIDVLRNQTERLEATLGKLRSHLKPR